MVIKVNELKQRFLTGDTPSPKDFADLIDTLVSIKNTTVAPGSLSLSDLAALAGNPSQYIQTDADGNITIGPIVFPAVSGNDGSIVGTLPDVYVPSDPSVDSNRGIAGIHIKNGAISLRHYNGTEASGATPGSALTWTGSGFAWQTAGAQAALQRVAASGAVRKFRSALIPLPTNAMTFTTFAQTLAHGLGFSPDTYRVALICTNSGGSAGYPQNREVPLNLFINQQSKPIFYTNTDSTNVYVDAIFSQVGSDYQMSVYDGTTYGQIDTLSMSGGDFANWSLVVYADLYLVGDGFGAVTGWTSTPTAFDHVVTTIVLTNVQGILPNSWQCKLQCITTDGAFNVGEEVDIDQFTASTFEPAFTVKASSTAYTIVTNVAYNAIQIGSYVITLDNWKVVVRAMYATGNSTSIQAPSAIQLHGVRNAVPYSGVIYCAHVLATNQTNSGAPTSHGPVLGYGSTPSVATSLLTTVNIQNGNTIIGANISSNPFPSSDISTSNGVGSGAYNTFGQAQLNLVRWPTLGVNALMWIRGNDTYFPMSGTPVNTVVVPFGGAVVSTVFVDSSPPTFSTYGAVPTGAANSALQTIWGTNSATGSASGRNNNPFPQHSCIIQVDDSGSAPGGTTHPDLYIVGSQFFPVPVLTFKSCMNNCRFGKYTFVSGAYAYVGPAVGSGSGAQSPTNSPAGVINWFNGNIVNISSRNADIFSTDAPNNPIYYAMVRYNPVKKLFYVIDALTGLLHIYSLAVTLQSWLGNGSAALDYTQLSYTGSYVIPMGPPKFDNVTFEDNGTTYGDCTMRDAWTVEFDTVSGAEISICVARGLTNDIVRIPWIYPI